MVIEGPWLDDIPTGCYAEKRGPYWFICWPDGWQRHFRSPYISPDWNVGFRKVMAEWSSALQTEPSSPTS